MPEISNSPAAPPSENTVDRTGIIRVETRDGEVLFSTRSGMRAIMAGRAEELRRNIEEAVGTPVTRLLIAPVAGYLLDVLPTLIDAFQSVTLADNFKAGQVFHGVECVPVDVAVGLARYDAVLLGTVDPQLSSIFSARFSSCPVVGWADLVARVAFPDSLATIRACLIEAEALIQHQANVPSLLKFFEALTGYACAGGEIGEFKSALNLLFQQVHPQTGELDETHRDMIESIRRFYADVARVPYPDGYVVSAHWDRKQGGFARAALLLDDPRHVVLCAQYGHLSGFDHRIIGDPATARAIISDKFVEIEKDFGILLPEHSLGEDSPFSISSSMENFDGLKYSNIFLSHLQYYLRLRKSVLGEFDRVLEIGGGYGGLARIFQAQRQLQYIIVDLPGSLVFSYTFLRLNFPEATFCTITTGDELSRSGGDKTDFVFVPPQFLSCLAGLDVDVVVNTGSMQEMPQETVDFFMNYIQSLMKVRYFYSHNYFISAKQEYVETSGGVGAPPGNLICPKLDAEWEITFSRLDPWGLVIDCAGRNWLEILVRRLDETTDHKIRASEHFRASENFPAMSAEWLQHSLAAVFFYPRRAYIENIISGIEFFFFNETEVPNNMFNLDGFGISYRSKYEPSKDTYIFNKRAIPSDEEKRRMFESLGEVRYFRQILAQLKAASAPSPII